MKFTAQTRRDAGLLLELLLTMAIIAVLSALLLGALQKARDAAIRAASANKLRLIGVAMHNYAAVHEKKLPTIADPMESGYRLSYRMPEGYVPKHYKTPLRHITPFIDGEQPSDYEDSMSSIYPVLNQQPRWRLSLFSPADPTIRIIRQRPHFKQVPLHPSSYVYNMLGFLGPMQLAPESFPDGLSLTFAFAEEYAMVGEQEHRDGMINSCEQTFGPFLSRSGDRRASFADAGWSDVMPITEGAPPVTRCSVPGMTFIGRPDQYYADDRHLNSPYPNLLLVCMFDGSVRKVAKGVHETAFWAAVTPNRGESASLD